MGMMDTLALAEPHIHNLLGMVSVPAGAQLPGTELGGSRRLARKRADRCRSGIHARTHSALHIHSLETAAVQQSLAGTHSRLLQCSHTPVK